MREKELRRYALVITSCLLNCGKVLPRRWGMLILRITKAAVYRKSESEVINKLVSVLKKDWFATQILGWDDNVLSYLSMLSALAVFHDKEVAPADAVLIFKRCIETRSISLQRLLKVYMDTTERIWVHAVTYSSLFNGAAATVFGNIILVYEREGVTQIPISNQELLVELQKGFAEEMGQFCLKIGQGCNLSKKRKLDDAT